jgi:ElaB/YqjD/DUF883 family membrane-anchored ribosome-binding protein
MFTSSAKEPVNDKERAKATIDHIEEGGRRIKRDARVTADRAHGDLNSMAHAVGEQVREFVETTGEGLAHAKHSISDVGDAGVAQIRQNPLLASGIALGVGVLMGAFLWRR